MNEDKCKDCFAHQYDEEFGDMCIAPLCMKEYDYDSETRTWIPIKKTVEKNKKESMNVVMIIIGLFVLFMILMKF